MKIQKILEMYEKGMITEGELMIQTLYESDRDLEGVPAEFIEKIKAYLDRSPRTDQEWEKSIYLQSWCGRAMPPTQEETRKRHKAACIWWRNHLNVT